MIKTYGIKATANHPEYGTVVKRAEISAGSAGEATGYMRGWCIVQGYGVESARFDVETDGMTYRQRMTRELTNAGARLSLRYGVDVIGPWEREPAYRGDEPRSITRLVLPNGWGVSLSSKMFDTFGTETNMVTGYPVDGDDWTCEFPCPELAYDTGASLDPEHDPEIGEILTALAKLPTRK